MKLMNCTELLGRELHVMWFRPGGLRDKVTGNLFVKGLAPTTKSRELFQLFSKFGEVASCRVSYDEIGKCKGYGYVSFETKEIAERAIAEMNGKLHNGVKMEIEYFKPRDMRGAFASRYNNLYVKGVPKKWTQDDFKKFFEQYGSIVSALAVKETNDAPENKGFGFVCYKSPEEAKAAEEKLKGTQLEGVPLFICQALRKADRKKQLREERLRLYKDCNLYVRDFPEDTNDDKLKAGFSQFGEVLSARVMLEKKQDEATGATEYHSKGFGFVCFKSPDLAKKAVENSLTTDILGKRLYVHVAESKEERTLKYMNHATFQPPYFNMGPPHMSGRRPFMPYYPPAPGYGMYPPRMRRPRMDGGRYGRHRPMGFMMPPEGMYPMGPMMPPGGYPSMMPPPVMPQAMIAPVAAPMMPVPQLPNDREALGEMLYRMVEKEHPDKAAKITGMLLEMEVEQIHSILRDPAQLKTWVDEALKVLNKPQDL